MQSRNPGIRYLDGIRLNRCLRAGIESIIDAQDRLNEINVFPVPDGDTGTNLAATADSIGACIAQLNTRHAGELLIRVADVALDGARGNSGAILAQFFQGLADSAEDKQRLYPADIFTGFTAGAEYARSAIAEPKPGTILTLVDTVAADLGRYHRDNPDGDFIPLLEHTLERARVALAETERQLDVLRRAHVVDAGAMGFVLLLEGIGNFLSEGSLRAVPVPRARAEATNALAGLDAPDGDLDFRYCTECLIHGGDIDQRKLRERLSAIGGSLVIAGSRRKTKIHIHVDEPAAVFAIAEGYGKLTGRKADDMRQQSHAVGTTDKRYAVITDSAADLPDDAMETYDIHIVPIRVQFGERSYLDKVGMTPQEFYRELQNNPVLPRTSQPAPGDYRRMYDFLGSHFEHVFCISLTSEISGTWQAAVNAAERARNPDAITVIDSHNVSLGQGLVTLHAAECITAGLARDDIAASTEAVRKRTRSYGLVTDLSDAVRGGRVHPAVHLLARALGIHPIIHASGNGEVAPGGFIFGGNKAIPRFIRHVTQRIDPAARYRLGVAHANNEPAATEIRARLLELNPNIGDSYLTEMGVALGVHTGPGAVAVALQALADNPAARATGAPESAGSARTRIACRKIWSKMTD